MDNSNVFSGAMRFVLYSFFVAIAALFILLAFFNSNEIGDVFVKLCLIIFGLGMVLLVKFLKSVFESRKSEKSEGILTGGSVGTGNGVKIEQSVKKVKHTYALVVLSLSVLLPIVALFFDSVQKTIFSLGPFVAVFVPTGLAFYALIVFGIVFVANKFDKGETKAGLISLAFILIIFSFIILSVMSKITVGVSNNLPDSNISKLLP